MSKHKNPIQKKNDCYTKDYVMTEAEYPHAFRKNLPKKKSRINQSFRSKIRQLSTQLTNSDDNNDVIETSIIECKRQSLNKLIPQVLKAAVTDKLQKRAAFVGQNYFKYKYYHILSLNKKNRFKKFIENIISENGIQTQRVAIFFYTALNSQHGMQQYSNAKSFLEDFFEQEPSFKTRILNWIDKNK